MSEERFDRIDATLQQLVARFDAVDDRLDTVDKRFDAVDKRLDAVDKRFDAVDRRFDAVDRRFDAVDKRLDAVEVGLDKLKVLHDETRGKVDLVLENIVATNERLDRFQQDVTGRFDEMRADVHVVLRNHNTRLGALEGRP